MKAKKGIFVLDGLQGDYVGYYTDEPGDCWNGDPQPLFTKEEAFRISQRFDSDDTMFYYDDIMECFVESDPLIWMNIYPENYETADGFKDLYPIGSMSWGWQLKE